MANGRTFGLVVFAFVVFAGCTQYPVDPGFLNNGKPVGGFEVPATATCNGYEFFSILGTEASGTELHVIGIYESRTDHGAGYHPQGQTQVDVQRSGNMVLVLSSYEPTHWIVTAGPDTVIERVILNGYHPQDATLPSGTALLNLSPVENSFGIYGYGSDDGGGDTPALIQAAEDVTRLVLTSFQGCYTGTAFTLEGGEEPDPCQEQLTACLALCPVDGCGCEDCEAACRIAFDACQNVCPDCTLECTVLWNELDKQENVQVQGGLSVTTTSTNDGIRATAGHVTGRFYFEVRIDQLGEGGFQGIGIGTRDLFLELGFFASDGYAAGVSPSIAGETIGVALDLDAGLVSFSRDGLQQEAIEVSVAPGVGPFFATVFLSEGDRFTANFGASPFAFPPPPGFAAYNTGLTAGADGLCLDEGNEPVQPAPVDGSCTDLTSYRSESTSQPELNVIGIYESRTDHGFGSHPEGTTTVNVERTGEMVLGLSSYEPTHWVVNAAAGTIIQRIVVIGYHAQRVSAPAGVPVEIHSYEQGDYLVACGFRWPLDTGGCDTQGLVRALEELTSLPLTLFAGCYTGTEFTIRDDEAAPADGWEALSFTAYDEPTECDGARYVRFNTDYGLFVGAALCSATRYKLFLAEERNGVYYQIGDYAGHGQDHCELVNPAFTIPNEDDITSGCPACDIGPMNWTPVNNPVGTKGWSRGNFGETFTFEESWPQFNLYTVAWIECDIAIP